MKKIVSIICIVLVLVATSNLAVNIHFCGNKVSSIDFFGKAKDCGGSCDSKTTVKEKSCCKNFSAIITTSDSKTTSFHFQTEQTAIALVPIIHNYTTPFVCTTEVLKGSIVCNAPPNISIQPYYILYSSLII